MTLHRIRRVVTGHSPAGKATVLFDGNAEEVLELPGMTGAGVTELWSTDESPVDIDSTVDRARPMRHDPTPNGTLFRVVEIPPGVDAEIDTDTLFDAMKSANRPDETARSKHPTMHRTDSIDYLVVVSGELVMLMGDGTEVLLRQGDCVVQQGTDHAWENRGAQPCLLAAVLVDAHRPAVVAND